MFTCLAAETSQRIRENIHSPRCGHPRGIFVTIARAFKLFRSLKTLDFMWVDFYI